MVAVVLGVLVGQLGRVDPLFLPLVLLGPLLTGAVGGARGLPAGWPVVLWLVAGLTMLVSDWLVDREDGVFHLAVAVVTALLAGATWAASRVVLRRAGVRA